VKRLCGAIVYVSCVFLLVVVMYLEIATVPTMGYMRNGDVERFYDLPLRSFTGLAPDAPRFRPFCLGLCTREELP
jgi:hypothetical protein